MPRLETPRGAFFYQKTGEAGPIVYLLHGLTAKYQDWESTPGVLRKAGFQVFAFDMKGHGQSDKPPSGYTPEDHAQDIEACARVLKHRKVHVVGHSTGGRNALFFAVLFPEKTSSLTIIDQTLTADPQSWKKHEQTYTEYPTPFMDEKSLDLFLMEKFPERERRRQFEKGQFTQRLDGRWDWTFSVPAVLETQKWGRAQAFHDLLSRVKCPLLFIKAGDSPYVSPEEAETIRQRMPSGQWVVIEKAGHGVFRDKPQEFTKLLVAFLNNAPHS